MAGVGEAAGDAVALEHETHEITKNGQVAGRSRGTGLAILALRLHGNAKRALLWGL